MARHLTLQPLMFIEISVTVRRPGVTLSSRVLSPRSVLSSLRVWGRVLCNRVRLLVPRPLTSAMLARLRR